MNLIARFIRGFCVGYLTTTAAREIGAWAFLFFAVWAVATVAVDVTEGRHTKVEV